VTVVRDGWVCCAICGVRIHNGAGLCTFVHGPQCEKILSQKLYKDAERYRWLRNHGGGIIPAPSGSAMVHGNLPYCVMYAPGVKPQCIELWGELLDKIVDQQLNASDTEAK
jgi:hypothetical protein